jgi:hypothetical protein
VLNGIPCSSLSGSPHRRLPRRTADNRVRDAGDVERRAPPPVAVLRQLQIPALVMEPNGNEPEAGPGVQPAVQEPQLGRAGREPEEAEGGAEGGEALRRQGFDSEPEDVSSPRARRTVVTSACMSNGSAK